MEDEARFYLKIRKSFQDSYYFASSEHLSKPGSYMGHAAVFSVIRRGFLWTQDLSFPTKVILYIVSCICEGNITNLETSCSYNDFIFLFLLLGYDELRTTKLH